METSYRPVTYHSFYCRVFLPIRTGLFATHGDRHSGKQSMALVCDRIDVVDIACDACDAIDNTMRDCIDDVGVATMTTPHSSSPFPFPASSLPMAQRNALLSFSQRVTEIESVLISNHNWRNNAACFCRKNGLDFNPKETKMLFTHRA